MALGLVLVLLHRIRTSAAVPGATGAVGQGAGGSAALPPRAALARGGRREGAGAAGGSGSCLPPPPPPRDATDPPPAPSQPPSERETTPPSPKPAALGHLQPPRGTPGVLLREGAQPTAPQTCLPVLKGVPVWLQGCFHNRKDSGPLPRRSPSPSSQWLCVPVFSVGSDAITGKVFPLR